MVTISCYLLYLRNDALFWQHKSLNCTEITTARQVYNWNCTEITTARKVCTVKILQAIKIIRQRVFSVNNAYFLLIFSTKIIFSRQKWWASPSSSLIEEIYHRRHHTTNNNFTRAGWWLVLGQGVNVSNHHLEDTRYDDGLVLNTCCAVHPPH